MYGPVAMTSSAGFRAHAAAENDWLTAIGSEHLIEDLQMLRPLRQHQAVSPLAQGFDDVSNYLLIALRVGKHVLVDPDMPPARDGSASPL
jgi:hypothetical protein